MSFDDRHRPEFSITFGSPIAIRNFTGSDLRLIFGAGGAYKGVIPAEPTAARINRTDTARREPVMGISVREYAAPMSVVAPFGDEGPVIVEESVAVAMESLCYKRTGPTYSPMPACPDADGVPGCPGLFLHTRLALVSS